MRLIHPEQMLGLDLPGLNAREGFPREARVQGSCNPDWGRGMRTSPGLRSGARKTKRSTAAEFSQFDFPRKCCADH
jgi:hypothetical protein